PARRRSRACGATFATGRCGRRVGHAGHAALPGEGERAPHSERGSAKLHAPAARAAASVGRRSGTTTSSAPGGCVPYHAAHGPPRGPRRPCMNPMRHPTVALFLVLAALPACTSESSPPPTAPGPQGAPDAPAAQAAPPAPNVNTNGPAPSAPESPIAAIDRFIAEQKIDKSDEDWRLDLPLPPKLTFADGKTYV